MNYNYCNTTKVFFEKDCSETLILFLKQMQYKRVLICSGKDYSKKIAKDLLSKLSVEFDTELFGDIMTNPIECIIEKATQKAKKFSPDVIITVGGGSVHDTGKVVSIMYYDKGNKPRDYTVTGTLGISGIKEVLPVVTIPIIYGSGAEVSPAALIRFDNKKSVIFSQRLHPIATFVDFSLNNNISSQILSRSAFDSFIQSLEGYLSDKANKLSDIFALDAINLFVDSFEKLKKNQIDEDCLENLAIASILSSYVCSVASVGAIHAISDPISGRHDIHHGTALAMVAIEVLKRNLPQKSEKLPKLLQACHLNEQQNTRGMVAEIIEMVQKIIYDLKIKQDIRIVLSEDEIALMAEESFNGDMDGNPCEFSKNEVVDIIRKI